MFSLFYWTAFGKVFLKRSCREFQPFNVTNKGVQALREVLREAGRQAGWQAGFGKHDYAFESTHWEQELEQAGLLLLVWGLQYITVFTKPCLLASLPATRKTALSVWAPLLLANWFIKRTKHCINTTFIKFK